MSLGEVLAQVIILKPNLAIRIKLSCHIIRAPCRLQHFLEALNRLIVLSELLIALTHGVVRVEFHGVVGVLLTSISQSFVVFDSSGVVFEVLSDD